MPIPAAGLAAQVIVVGGGPAGSATAWALASAGADVLIVDRARFPRDKPCAEYLSPQASRILEAMGVLRAAESMGAAQLEGMMVRAPGGALIHGEFAARHGFRGFRDRGLALRRHLLDALLLDAARAAGARVMEGARVVDVVRDAHGRAAGVSVLDPDHIIGSREDSAALRGGVPARELRAPILVGADGLRSIVARRMGLARSARWPRRTALVTHYRGIRGMTANGEMHVDAHGYLGIANVGRGEINVALVVPASRARALLADGPAACLDRWIDARPHLAERFADARRVAPIHATGPFAAHARRSAAGGVALVGDASDFFDPFTGEGIYAALRGGEMVAPFVLEAIAASTPARADRILGAYHDAQRREFAGKRIVERLIGAAVAFPPLIDRAARVLSARKDMADLLVGVTGDFVPAREVLKPSYLLSLLLPVRASPRPRPRPAGPSASPPAPATARPE